MQEMVDASSLSSRKRAALVLALHLDHELWLARRTDVATLADVSRVSWSMALQVQVDFDRLTTRFPHLDLWDRRQILLPLLFRLRTLLTGFSMRDHDGRNVAMLTWDESRPLIVEMVRGAGTAALQRVDALKGRELDPVLDDALRRYGGDIGDVEYAVTVLNEALTRRTPHIRHTQALALWDDPLTRLLLEEQIKGFIVMAPVMLRPDGSCDVYIKADSAVTDGVIRVPVSASPQYQFEISLPEGVRLRDRPALVDSQTGERIPIGVERRSVTRPFMPTVVKPWAEVNGSLLAGYAPREPRGTDWELEVLPSIRCTVSLPERVRTIARLTLLMLLVGLIARCRSITPVEGAAAPLVAAFPTVYGVLLLSSSPPTQEAATKEPRRWLVAIIALTFIAASDLVLKYPGSPPVVDRWSWGPRAAVWLVVTLAMVAVAAVVEIRSRRVW